MCFRYKVLTQICVLAKFTRDPTKNTFSWIHTGGCFEDDANANYVDAVVGDVYDFKNIQFEVREDMRANAEAAVEEPEAEPEDLGDDISEGESTKKQTGKDKIKAERENLDKEVEDGKLTA